MTAITDPDSREQHKAWMFHELNYVRREAQSDAELAYETGVGCPAALDTRRTGPPRTVPTPRRTS